LAEEDSGNLILNCWEALFSAEIQDKRSRSDNRYSPLHVEFGMNSEFNFGDFSPRNDMPLLDTTDHNLSLPTIGIQFANKTTAWTCDVINRSVTTSSYGQICTSIFRMAQHNTGLN
jgi:hypothetical protein